MLHSISGQAYSCVHVSGLFYGITGILFCRGRAAPVEGRLPTGKEEPLYGRVFDACPW